MKFSEEMRFPHPVLSADTADFGKGELRFGVTVEERPDDGELKLSYDCDVTEPDIRKFIDGGRARAGLFVTCLETFFNRLEDISVGKGSLNFSGGLLNGRVVLRPVIWSDQAISGWKSPNIHGEFGPAPIALERHELLGIGEELVINVGWEKLRPLETIFTLAVSPDLPDGRIAIDLEADRIRILVSQATHDSINRYRGQTGGKAILLNGVYLPAVMEVIRNLSVERQRHEQRRWYRPFIAKCEHLSINLENPDLLESAQRLLSYPYLRLMEHEARIFS